MNHMKNRKKIKRKSQQHKLILFYSLAILLIGISIIVVNQTARLNNRSLAVGGDCTVSSTQLQISAKEQELFDLVNNYRASKNIPKITWDPVLNKAGSWLSNHMLVNKRMNHLDLLNRYPEQRLPDCGYSNPVFGENIASGDQIAVDIFNTWKSSPQHNENMLNAKFTIGAVALESDPTKMANYWTFMFGTSVSAVSPTLPGSQPTITNKPPTLIPQGPTGSPFPTTRLTYAPTHGASVPSPATLHPTGSPIPEPSVYVLPITPVPSQIMEITPTAQPITPDMKIEAKVKIQGIGKGGNFFPKHLTRKVTAVIYDGSDLPVAKGSAYLTYDKEQYFTGTIHLGRMSQGIYYVKLMSFGTLLTLVQPEFQHLSINKPNPLPPVTLIQGDINGDNVISIMDYNLALSCFQNKFCQVKEVIDLNDDSLTDVTDYNLLLQSFMQLRGQ